MQDREGGYTRARPVRQNPVYSSLSFFHSFFLSFFGLNVMAQTARLTEQRPKRNGPTGGGHCASLAYWSFHMDSYSSPFGERKTLYLHCAMALYKTGFRATHNGVLCLSLKGHNWQGEEKKVECEILMPFFSFSLFFVAHDDDARLSNSKVQWIFERCRMLKLVPWPVRKLVWIIWRCINAQCEVCIFI